MRVFVTAVALAVAAGSMVPAYAQAPLSVPYLPQSEALCGGAAAAMVMRFWGAQGVYADAFAPLVDKAAGGIRTSALTRELESRGWRADAGGGDVARLSGEVRAGRPVIALIEDRPNRYHYVVVVAASEAGPILVHDPARAPSRSFDLATFERKWTKTERWMLVMQPPVAGVASGSGGAESSRDANQPSDVAAVPAAPASACQLRVDEAVGLASRGEKDAARGLLVELTRTCPRASAAWRELAGLDALEQRWAETADHARTAVALDSKDDHAWRLLATAEFLLHNDLAALAAWNRLGEPRVDLIDIKGLRHTRYMVVADAIGLEPRDLLTPDAIRVAQKRVRDIPAVAAARVAFRPAERGTAQIDATIVERERAPRSYPSWLAIGAGALANREASTTFANVTGGGDAVDVTWRWWEHRPRVAASYSAPGPFGIWRIAAAHETQTFGVARVEETRTQVGGDVSNWLSDRVRLGGGLALDRWRGDARTLAASFRSQYWPLVDRLALEAGVSGWRGEDTRFGAADARVRWRSRTTQTGYVVLATTGYQFASNSAPASIWPGADTGHARDVLLRAHPLLDDGVIEGGVFGRRVAFGSIEAQRWMQPMWHGLLRLAPAAFVDIARARHGLDTTDTRVHYDAGVGLRVSIPGSGVLRVDIAQGLRDGRTALSVGWQR